MHCNLLQDFTVESDVMIRYGVVSKWRFKPFAQQRCKFTTRNPNCVDHQLKDVHVDSLEATLEAHRASNRARLIRHIPIKSRGPLSIGERITEEAQKNIQETHGGKADSKAPETFTSMHTKGSQKYRGKITPYLRSTYQSLDDEATLRSFGSYIPPSIDWTPPGRPLDEDEVDKSRPYIKNIESLEMTGDISSKLQIYILALESWLQISTEERRARAALRDFVINFVKKRLPEDSSLDCFGSEQTGLALPTSDIDVGVSLASFSDTSIKKRRQTAVMSDLLRDIQNPFQNEEIMDVQYILEAKFPLIKFNFKRSSLTVDIVGAGGRGNAVEYVKAYLEEFPHLRPIYMVIRLALQARGLATTTTGGLSSYCLIMMLMTYFRSPNVSRQDELGFSLIGFLKWWANRNTTDFAFSADPFAIWKKRERTQALSKNLKKEGKMTFLQYSRNHLSIRDQKRPYLLTLQDPVDLTNDLGFVTKRIMDIRETFRKLAEMLQRWQHSPNNAIEDPFANFFGSRLSQIHDQRLGLLQELDTIGLKSQISNSS